MASTGTFLADGRLKFLLSDWVDDVGAPSIGDALIYDDTGDVALPIVDVLITGTEVFVTLGGSSATEGTVSIINTEAPYLGVAAIPA